MIERNFNDWVGKDEEERDERDAKDEAAWANAEAAIERDYENDDTIELELI